MNTATAEKIKGLRESKKMTQIDLAAKAGISLSSVRLIEQGARVSNNIKRKVAHALGITLAEIGGPNVAKWVKTETPEETKNFGEQIQVFFDALCKKADAAEREYILFDDNNMSGFQEILYLARKYQVELPNLE